MEKADHDRAPLLKVARHEDAATDFDTTAAEEEDGFSLEELSQTYSKLLGTNESAAPQASEGQSSAASAGNSLAVRLEADESDRSDESDKFPLTPQSIVEAILFLGKPDNSPTTAAEMAALMRGVSEQEVVTLIEQLNILYENSGRAMRVVEAGAGYRMQLADELSFIRDRFYGRAREIQLNQAAIDCLALVAYQPGLSREKLEQQRGQPSGAVLNQLVRRQLLEMRRVKSNSGTTQHYYPTPRLLQLAGLASLEDLPQTEDL